MNICKILAANEVYGESFVVLTEKIIFSDDFNNKLLTY